MAYSGATTIKGPSRGSADAFFNWATDRGSARLADVRLYLNTVYDLAPKVGMRAEVLVAQAVLEASENGAPWSSFWWKERCNCIGNGITGDAVQDAASRDFENGRNIALCHLVHDWLYAVGRVLPAELEPHREQDPRWDAAVQAGHAGKAPTIDEFTGRYAMDPRYGKKWVARLHALEAAGLTGEPDIPDEEEEPDDAMFAAPSVINELRFDSVAPAIVEHDGSTFIYVDDIVEAIRDTPRLQLGFEGAPVVGPNISSGLQFRVQWIYKTDDQRWYYYTRFATRVLVEDTKRIEDVEE